MNNQEKMGMHGAMSMVLLDKDGNIKQSFTKDNIVVDVGFDFIADAIGKSSSRPSVMSHIGVGTDDTAPASTDTALGTQALRKAAAYNHVAGTKVFTFSASFEAGEATGALTESGVFNAASGGIMLDRVTYPVVNKGADDTLTVNFTFTMS